MRKKLQTPSLKFSAIFLLLTSLSLIVGVRCSTQSPTYASLSPSTAYLGNESCQSCHQEISESYAKTNMGHSVYAPDPNDKIEVFGPEQVVYDKHFDFYYHPFWKNNKMYILEFRMNGADTIFKRLEQVDLTIGSGNQTRSFLIQRKGYLYEMPITWYVNKGLWDLSPGYHDGNNSRFSREIGEECMACHTAEFEFFPDTKNRYRKMELGIDCERCHGPGGEHVKLAKQGKLPSEGIDYSIINPTNLPFQEQVDVCQQCHLEGLTIFKEDHKVRTFRPGMTLESSCDIFLPQNAGEQAFGTASHAERLQQAQCFIQSKGEMTCSTCHDPHKAIDKDDQSFFIRKCEQCHSEGNKKMCVGPEDLKAENGNNCISCHLAFGGTSDIPHVSFHDHKIRILEEKEETPPPAITKLTKKYVAAFAGSDDASWGRAWLKYYETLEPDAEALRLATMKIEPATNFESARMSFYTGNNARALGSIERAVKQNPEQSELWFWKGAILQDSKKPAEASVAFSKAYELNPEMLEAGLKAGNTLLNSRQGDASVLAEARDIFKKLLVKKPFDPRLLANLGFIELNAQNYAQAEQHLLKALSLDPDHLKSLYNLTYLYLARFQKDKAQQVFNRLKIAHPESAEVVDLEGKI